MSNRISGLKRKKIIIPIVIVALFAGALVANFAYKNIKEQAAVTVAQTTSVTAEQVQADTTNQILATGQFKDGDAVHQGSGTAKIIETNDGPKLLFENFSTIPGPDLFVYLSPNPSGQDLGAFASLGKLKSITGNQVYDLPENFKDYKSVVVWCRAFSVTFTNADLVYGN